MPKPRLNARDIIHDVRAGFDDMDLMEKYSLSSIELIKLFDKLVKAGLVERSELDERVPYYERTVEISFSLPDWKDTRESPGNGGASPQEVRLKPDPATSAATITTAAASAEDPLILAAKAGLLQDVKRCIKGGASVNVRGLWGMEALTWACSKGHFDVARLLIARGADVNATTNNGSTALMWACYAGHEKVVQLLLDYGADVNAKSVQGRTALIAASHNGHLRIVRLLLNRNSAIIVKDSLNKTALDYAKERGHPEIVTLIVQHYKASKRASSS
jgi:hypothetical protein